VKKKEALKIEAHAEGPCLRYPPQAVSTQFKECGVEPVLKQPDLPQEKTRPKKKKGKGRTTEEVVGLAMAP